MLKTRLDEAQGRFKVFHQSLCTRRAMREWSGSSIWRQGYHQPLSLKGSSGQQDLAAFPVELGTQNNVYRWWFWFSQLLFVNPSVIDILGSETTVKTNRKTKTTHTNKTLRLMQPTVESKLAWTRARDEEL